VNYLRFTRQEYQAVCRLCDPLRLDGCPLGTFRRFLVASLADPFPALAERLNRLRNPALKLLYDHLRVRRQPDAVDDGPPFTAEEFQAVAEACGPLLLHARFVRLFRAALLEHFRAASPALAEKLERLSLHRFELLREQVQGRTRRGA
jgi:hypothetical protein